MYAQLTSGKSFEDEVRRIARLIWPSRAHQGALIVDGLERDAYIETDDAIHIIEATTDRRIAKAEYDLKKTSELVGRLRKIRNDKVVKGWFITKDELTADQAAIAQKYTRTVTSIPYKDFLSRLIDAREYLTLRENRSFGSVADPFRPDFKVERKVYVPPFFFSEFDKNTFTFNDFYDSCTRENSRSVLLGDFGAGKSMNLREVFYRAAADFNSGRSQRFPIYLNLRSHTGQPSPTEALIREAMNTGYSRYDDLVKAWRADLTLLLLDGFDELITPIWSSKASQLREHRASCVSILSDFIVETPRETPVVISGRLSYFGSISEMERSLRLQTEYGLYHLNDFTKEQAETFLSKIDIHDSVPEWLPQRPLLLGYIAALAADGDINLGLDSIDPSIGWDYLFDRICDRETLIQKGLFKESVRRVLERIGTKARYRNDARLPISQADIASAFAEIFDKLPDENSLGMLMRLPGLVSTGTGAEDRRFVDVDFASIAAAGDVFEFVNSPNVTDPTAFEKCSSNIDFLAAEFINYKLRASGRPDALLGVSLLKISEQERLSCLKGDLLITIAKSELEAKDHWITVKDASIDEIDLTQSPNFFSRITLVDATINTVELDNSDFAQLPEFRNCIIDTIRGPSALNSLSARFIDCEINKFDFNLMTNDSFQDLKLDDSVIVGLTVLRKLYLQPGGGRQEGAFFRGLKPKYRKLVPDVLSVIVSEGYARLSNRSGAKIYVKNTDSITSARQILSQRGNVKLPLIDALKRIH